MESSLTPGVDNDLSWSVIAVLARTRDNFVNCVRFGEEVIITRSNYVHTGHYFHPIGTQLVEVALLLQGFTLDAYGIDRCLDSRRQQVKESCSSYNTLLS